VYSASFNGLGSFCGTSTDRPKLVVGARMRSICDCAGAVGQSCRLTQKFETNIHIAYTA
jgi:hypothetical protein